MAYKSSEEARAYQRAYYKKNRKRITARWRKYRSLNKEKYDTRVKKWREANRHKLRAYSQRRAKEDRAKLSELKAKLGCSKCPERHPAALDFHHKTRKNKMMSVALMAGGFSWSKILREVRKCVVLCSNCHRKAHWSRP